MISVHAISMIYELRAMRSRLETMLSELHTKREHDELHWLWLMTHNLIRKTESTGEYIASLEQPPEDDPAPPEARVGTGFHDRDADPDSARCSRCSCNTSTIQPPDAV